MRMCHRSWAPADQRHVETPSGSEELSRRGETSLTQLLEEESNAEPYYTLEDAGQGLNAEKSGFDAAEQQQQEEEHPWDAEDATNSALQYKENAIARFLKDLMRTSKRSWSRYKKGGHRSCFGVRLDRIGSFSGLGC
ncbi:hypothetical protein CRUP_038817 [Coryphaenoides rupestris]|nr:hypothetical protein CRUP_038817 [Coryphaenoides rupestris]